MRKKTNRQKTKRISRSQLVWLGLFAFILTFAALYLYAVSSKSNYVIFIEDTANSCSGGLSSATRQDLVEVKVPKNEVDKYLQSASSEHRCVWQKTEEQ